MRRTSRVLFVPVFLCSAGSAFAAGSAALQVTGKIAPSACHLSISNVEVDVGHHTPHSEGHYPEASGIPLTELSISCAAPMGVKLLMSSTAPVQAAALTGWSQNGSGVSALDVGGVLMLDGEPGFMAYSSQDANWKDSRVDGVSYLQPMPYLKNTFVKTSTATSVAPTAFKNAVIDMHINLGRINQKVDFSKGEIKLDQTLAFEIEYM